MGKAGCEAIGSVETSYVTRIISEDFKMMHYENFFNLLSYSL